MPVARLARAGKLSALRLLEAAGIAAVVRDSAWRRNRLLILCYHGVSLADEHEWSDLYVSEGHLRRRFRYLRDGGYEVVPLAEALTALREGALPDRSVALTFDDGAFDFYAKAYPLLREFGFHATLYQTTYYSEFQRPVFDTVSSYLLWKGRGRRVKLPPELGGTQQVPLEDDPRLAMHSRLRALANSLKMSGHAKDDVARLLANQVGVDYDALLSKRFLHLMNATELADLDSRVVSVQLHTHRHRTPRDEGHFVRELTDNRAALEEMRGKVERLEHFCYPSGDYDRCFFPWLEATGVWSATTCDPGIVSATSERMLLPRLVDTMLTPDIVFESWLSGVAEFLPRRRGLTR